MPRTSKLRGNVLTFREQMLKDEQQRLAVASRIRELRGATPQPVIADRVGVGLRGYQKWEATGGISWENLQKLAKVHGVDANWILKGDAPGTAPDLMGAVNGDANTLDRIEAKLDRLITALGLEPEAEPVEEATRAAEAAEALASEPARSAPKATARTKRPAGRPRPS